MKNTNSRINYEGVAERIIALKNADLELRDKLIQNGQLGEGYNEEMEALHNSNAKVLNEIIESIGYPTSDKVGKEASEATWLVIQHSIGQPDFMKKCVGLLEKAVSENRADPMELAYMKDRIAVIQGELQLYGTQFDWDKNGELNPRPFDDINEVNHRRKSIGLNTVEEQIQVMRRQVESEKQFPPTDFEKRKQNYDKWRKTVGWIK